MSGKDNKEKNGEHSTGATPTGRNPTSGEHAKDSDQEQAFEEPLEQGGDLAAKGGPGVQTRRCRPPKADPMVQLLQILRQQMQMHREQQQLQQQEAAEERKFRQKPQEVQQ